MKIALLMKVNKAVVLFLLFFFLLLVLQKSFAQYNLNKFPVNYQYNRIENSNHLSPFFKKLKQLEQGNRKTVTIVHIGDSHIQADFLSGTIRTRLQQKFGNAGRGLIFPYQLAQSNTPADISSRSNISWEFNRVAHPEIPLQPGISGFVIKTNALMPSIEIELRSLKNDSSVYFNSLQFFIDTSLYSSWFVQVAGSESRYALNNNTKDSLLYRMVYLDKPSDRFSLSAIPTSTEKFFYGVSLLKNNPGILYHNLGVNGARYDQFNKADLLFQQLPSLHADLYIISLGTNEAQQSKLDAVAFVKEVGSMIAKLKSISPDACILITSPPDSFKNGRSNPLLPEISYSLTSFCRINDIAFWNLFMATTGTGSCYKWKSANLMAKDGIHFNAEGYKIQGNLLFDNIMKTYLDYLSSY